MHFFSSIFTITHRVNTIPICHPMQQALLSIILNHVNTIILLNVFNPPQNMINHMINLPLSNAIHLIHILNFDLNYFIFYILVLGSISGSEVIN